MDFDDLMKLFYKYFVCTFEDHESRILLLKFVGKEFWILVVAAAAVNQSIDQSILELEEF